MGEDPPIIDQAANGNAAEADAVIAFFAPDDPCACALADGALVGDGDFQSSIDRFRARAGEEDPVELGVSPAWRGCGELRGEVEGDRMAHLERRGIVEGGKLPLDRLGDLPAAVTGVAAPEPGRPVQHPVSIDVGVVHSLRRGQEARRGLELPVRRERHPEIFEYGRVRLVQLVHSGLPGMDRE